LILVLYLSEKKAVEAVKAFYALEAKETCIVVNVVTVVDVVFAFSSHRIPHAANRRL
jgi:hypothetical protein